MMVAMRNVEFLKSLGGINASSPMSLSLRMKAAIPSVPMT